MKTFFKTIIKNSGYILILSFALISCEEEAPTKVYDGGSGTPAPKINSIEPTDSVFSYVTVIKISGENFSASTDAVNGNKVYFNNRQGMIVSASSTEINVLTPDISGDSLRIKIVSPPAIPIAEYYPYKIFPAEDKLEQFNPLESVTAIELDSEGNLYGFVTVALTGIIYKITPDGNKTEYGTAAFPSASDMKFAPGGYLYVQQSGSRNIHRINPGGGAAQVFISLPNNNDRMRYYDFDENQILFAGGVRTGIFAINHQSGIANRVGNYGNHDIKSIRVFGGFVYVSATYNGTNTTFPPEGIWRSQILSAGGDLGEPEVVFDWSVTGFQAGALAGIPITFSAAGDLFIGTDENNSVLIVHPDGSFESLYPGFIEPTALQIVWGNGKFLYQNRSNSDVSIKGIYKIYMDRLGSSYYGRQ